MVACGCNDDLKMIVSIEKVEEQEMKQNGHRGPELVEADAHPGGHQLRGLACVRRWILYAGHNGLV